VPIDVEREGHERTARVLGRRHPTVLRSETRIRVRARLEANQAEVKQRTIDATRMLQGWGGIVSERDIARMINLSHQRVHQLVAEAG
jgi:hypothetical protein